MKNIGLVILLVIVLLNVVDDILAFLHAEEGYLGYLDKWDKPIYEKIHCILCAVSAVLSMADMVFALIYL